MSDKSVLFLDADFINDLYGRGNYDQSTGDSILDALSETHDLYIKLPQ